MRGTAVTNLFTRSTRAIWHRYGWRISLSLALVASRLTPAGMARPIKPLMIALIRCGENSLSIYCLGVLLAFLADVVMVEVSGGFAIQLALSSAGIAAMVIAANFPAWEAQHDRRGPKLF